MNPCHFVVHDGTMREDDDDAWKMFAYFICTIAIYRSFASLIPASNLCAYFCIDALLLSCCVDKSPIVCFELSFEFAIAQINLIDRHDVLI